ncbi:Translational regulator CsrA [Cellulomonas sp. T2.31MG-18]|uniref:carbon storage regulator CsrA n=1 Tax=Cellulomonas sp. T2.31MG-18 TaxID=3157619 RepID=UPI0035EBE93F
MLVLSRRVGERLVIGGDIVVTVIEVRSDGVRLGIDAPRSVRVHRAEVLEAISSANEEAVAADAGTEAALRRIIAAPPSPATPVDPAVPAAPATPAVDSSGDAPHDR